jgi:hypothetical protein
MTTLQTLMEEFRQSTSGIELFVALFFMSGLVMGFLIGLIPSSISVKKKMARLDRISEQLEGLNKE